MSGTEAAADVDAPPPAPILVFVNPASGSGEGLQFIAATEGIENIHFVRLPAEASTFAETYRDLLQDDQLRIVSAGGDGTANWVVSLLSAIFPNQSDAWKPPIAICPFGTGNDLSRALGWGPTFAKLRAREVKKFIGKVRSAAHIEKIDLWNVKVSRTDIDEVVSKQMLNYFSIGVDAAMSNCFESCRNHCRCCFCCHCMSKTLYVPMGFAVLFGQDNLSDVLHGTVYDTSAQNVEVERAIEFKRGEKTFDIQCIPSIYGGRDLWRNGQPRSVSDGKFEIICQGNSAALGMTHLGVYLGREVCQATKFRGITSEPIAYQIDGEGAVCNGPANIEIDRIGSYPFCYSQ